MTQKTGDLNHKMKQNKMIQNKEFHMICHINSNIIEHWQVKPIKLFASNQKSWMRTNNCSDFFIFICHVYMTLKWPKMTLRHYLT